MRYKLHLLLYCFTLALQVKAQSLDTTYNFSLNEAIDYAQKYQANVINAQIDDQIAKNTVKKTIGIGLPQVSGSFAFQDYLNVPTVVIPAGFGGGNATETAIKMGTTYQSSAGLDVTQLLFDGSYIVGLQAANTYKELSVRNLKRTRIETAVAVTKAYYSILVSNEKLTLLDANLERLKKSLSDTEALYKNGLVEKIDVDRLSVLKNNLETERKNLLRMLDLNNTLLKFQMGMPIQAKLLLKDTMSSLETEAMPVIVSDTTAYKSRIEYAILQTQKRLNELDLKRYKSQFLPTLAAFGNATKNFMSEEFSTLYNRNFPSTVIGLKLTLPIISGGQRIYTVRNAKLEVLKTDNNVNQLKNAINLEIAKAQTSYTNGLQSLENQKRNMELAKEVLRVSRVKYEQGVGSSLEVTMAETSLKEAQNDYINALYDTVINKVNLDQALGKINY